MCKLTGLFILNDLKKVTHESEVIYRDDGIFAIRKKKQVEQKSKKLRKNTWICINVSHKTQNSKHCNTYKLLRPELQFK